MAGDTVITIIGNLTADPELRFTPSGAAVANFTVASTPRQFDRQSNEWKDGETLFMRCSVWRDAAENVAESLQRGTRVIVSGRLKSRSYETKEGEKRTVVEMDVDEIGPSLRSATAKVNKTQRGGAGGGGFGGGQGGQGGSGWGAPAGGGQAGQAEDPWATGGSTPAGQGAGGQGGQGGQGGGWGQPAAAPGAPQGGQGGGWGAAPSYDEPPF
ncbi:single-stranded DNA-binding protein [Humibacillus xanthopallidus]|uniref:single-stranded DNA-binding protein n=1 Tax=Humibacillus xanthopallidus TaxID=412689 RepID=UPI003850EBF0